MLSARAVKKEVKARILSPAWRAEAGFFGDLPERKTATALLGLLPSHLPETKWRAVASLGAVTAAAARQNPESGREVMRRLAWAMNEESGAVGLGCCEAMAEIMANSEILAPEFLNLLISYVSSGHNQLLFEPLLTGALWGLWRLAGVYPALVRERCRIQTLAPYLGSEFATARTYAGALLPLWGKDGFEKSEPQKPTGENLVHWDGEKITALQDLQAISPPAFH